MGKLFSEQEIEEIQKEAIDNLEYYLGTTVIIGDSTQKTIITISECKQLIFVEGNPDTGFEHIRNRHAPFSFRNYWRPNEKGEIAIDKPSKFNPEMMPIVEYVKIAECIFEVNNKNITKNNRPDCFDKYTGSYTFDGGKAEKYHLITYKDTRIVHSLFPEKKTHNRNSKTRFGKGIVSVTTKFPEDFNDLIIPYEYRGVVRYSVLIRKFYLEKTERTFILSHDSAGKPESSYQIAERPFERYETFSREDMNQYQLSDLHQFESLIEKIDKSTRDDQD